MIYDSKAILELKYLQTQDKLEEDGWEFVKKEHGVVYLRKPYEQEIKNDE